MHKNFWMIYFYLTIVTIIQIFPWKFSVWMPDASLLFVVLTPLVVMIKPSLMIALYAGFLRCIFDPHIFIWNLFFLPVICFSAYLMSKIFYKQSSIFHIFLAGISLYFFLALQGIAVEKIVPNIEYVYNVFILSWRGVTTTMILSPFFFRILSYLYRNKADKRILL
ncbi:MAG: hypothetical protein HQL29_00450 [Candidatus Omnitrophica bacterium]|nr:hypothetical protein [Candidatus Omnitrophota bacterium]